MKSSIKQNIQKWNNNNIQEIPHKKKQDLLFSTHSIPQNQIKKFETTLDFLKQRPLENYVESEFIKRIKNEAFLSEVQLNLILASFKMDKKLLNPLQKYLKMSFNHCNNLQKQSQDISKFQSDEVKKQKQSLIRQGYSKQSQQEFLLSRIILMSSYETMKVKVLIESLIFLKNIFQERLIHKKLTNEFQKNDFMKKLQVFNQSYKPNANLNRKCSSLLRFNSTQIESVVLKNSRYIDGQKLQNDSIAILEAKIYTIVVLEYEKLLQKQNFFRTKMHLLKKAIQKRQRIWKTLSQNGLQNLNFQQLEHSQKYLNLTFYLILMTFNLQLQFQEQNNYYVLIKELKRRKDRAKQFLLQFQKTKLQTLVDLQRLYLSNLQKISHEVKRKLSRELIGQECILHRGKGQSVQQAQKYNESKTNYQIIKNSIYELTINVLNQENKKNPAPKNRSNQRILQQYIRNHNQVKSKKQSQQQNPHNYIDNELKQNQKNKSLSVKQMEKCRSLTLLRKNLHRNIFKNQACEEKTEKTSANARYMNSMQKRSKSVFNFTKKNSRQNELSIKKLLESPLTRQIEIYLQYQKFLNNSSDKKQQSISSAKSRIIVPEEQSQKQNGMHLIEMIMRQKNDPKHKSKLLTSSKKKKINTIYKAFAYNNKIIDISHWKLQEQIKDSNKNYFFNKKIIKNQLTDPVCRFGAGIRNLNSALDELLAERCYMGIHFMKFWQTKPYDYKMRLSQQESNFTLYLRINNFPINIVLPRGNNILCERYHTIWPTIRYLFQKKIFQFPIIKFFEHIFNQKKSSQNQAMNTKSQNEVNNLQGQHSLQSKSTLEYKNLDRAYSNENDHNECSVYRASFGQVSSDEVEELNSCFDYVHKFLGLIFSTVRQSNGTKQKVWGLQDNSSMKHINELDEVGQQNKQKILSESERIIRKTFLWRRIAKFWVTLEKLEEVHLVNFILKANEENYFFFEAVVHKGEIKKIFETFMANSVFHQNLSQEDKQLMKKNYKDIEVEFKLNWRSIPGTFSTNKNQLSSTIKVTFERLDLFQLQLKYVADSLMNIVVDNYYDSKFVQSLKNLLQKCLRIQTSIKGQMLHDLFNQNNGKVRKINSTNEKLIFFRDLYKSNQNPDKSSKIFDKDQKMYQFYQGKPEFIPENEQFFSKCEEDFSFSQIKQSNQEGNVKQNNCS